MVCWQRVRRRTWWQPSGCYGAPSAVYYPGTARDRLLAGRYAAQSAAFVGGQRRHRSPKSSAQVGLAGIRLPRPGVIYRVASGFSPAIGPLKEERMICRERLRLLLSDRDASGGRKSLIQKCLRSCGGLKDGVRCPGRSGPVCEIAEDDGPCRTAAGDRKEKNDTQQSTTSLHPEGISRDSSHCAAAPVIGDRR